jgi:hypothetical protein
MKAPSGSSESEQIESSSAPQPFNLFAGLSEEQLPGTTVQTNVPAKLIPPATPQRTAETIPNRSAGVYWAAAIFFALLIIAIFLAL